MASDSDTNFLFFKDDRSLFFSPCPISRVTDTILENSVAKLLARLHAERYYTIDLWLESRLDSLKVPKCEIFDLLDFNDFYVIKSL